MRLSSQSSLDLSDRLFYGSVIRISFAVDTGAHLEATLSNIFGYARVFEKNLGAEFLKRTLLQVDNFILLTLYFGHTNHLDNATRSIVMGTYFKDTSAVRSIVISSIYYFRGQVECAEGGPCQEICLLTLGPQPEKIKKGFILSADTKFQSSRNLMQEEFSWHWNPFATLSRNTLLQIWEKQLTAICEDIHQHIYDTAPETPSRLILLAGNHGAGKSIMLKRIHEKIRHGSCAVAAITTKKVAYKLIRCQQTQTSFNNFLVTWAELIASSLSLMQARSHPYLPRALFLR